jgi:hypothetical protein
MCWLQRDGNQNPDVYGFVYVPWYRTSHAYLGILTGAGNCKYRWYAGIDPWSHESDWRIPLETVT